MPSFGKKKNRLAHAVLVVFSVVSIFPLLWVVLTSLKTQQQIFDPGQMLPTQLTLANYYNVIFKANFMQYFGNSLLVAGGATVISILLSVTCAYGLTRYRIKWGNKLKMGVLYTRMFPGVLLSLPYYVIMRSLHLGDTRMGLILIYCSFVLPFAIWNMQTFFAKLPWELEEAAAIDGASRLVSLFRVMLPIARPGIVATTLYAFMMSWDEFMFANLFITSDSKKTISLGMQSFIGEYSTDWGSLMAAAVISLMPIILFFVFAQKSLVSGLAAGAVKG